MSRKFLFAFLVFSFAIISLSFASAAIFWMNGTVTDENGNLLGNSTVTLTARNMSEWGVAGMNSTVTNSTGGFNFNISSNITWVYELSIVHKNISAVEAGELNLNYTDYVSKSIPAFPASMMVNLAGTNFYLVPAARIVLNVTNSSWDYINFSYQIKDIKLGYPIASDFANKSIKNIVITVPRDRNYSIMVYPVQSMPASFEWTNFSTACVPSNCTTKYNVTTPGNGNNISFFNFTTRTLYKTFNLTTSMINISGFFFDPAGVKGNFSGVSIVPFIMEPGNIVHLDSGKMPYNMSVFIHSPLTNNSDSFLNTTGFFNMSFPSTPETTKILLFATARNGTSGVVYLGGFRNISLTSGIAPLFNLNFSMRGLLGSENNISMNRINGSQVPVMIGAARQQFNLVGSNNLTLSNVSAHIEVTVDYSSYNSTEFTWIVGLSTTQEAANFSLPLINTTGIKEMNVFASGGPSGETGQYAPKRASFSASQLLAGDNNITMKTFSPESIEAGITSNLLTMALYISNQTCDIPVPPANCLLSAPGGSTMDAFNPMKAIFGGGKISFRMGYGGIQVHYINVDMLASGPPDALFEASTKTTGETGFAKALKFGSSGPTIYDSVLVSVPYTEDAGSGLNDSNPVNFSVPILYDDKWNVAWNVTSNGTNMAGLGQNFSHYSARQSEWGNLTLNTTCTNSTVTNTTQINSTSPCYIDYANSIIWIRLPHFSGTGVNVKGTTLASSGTTAATTSGGTLGGENAWIATYSPSEAQLSQGYTQNMIVRSRVKTKINNTEHYVGVVGLTTTSATINVSSTPQQVIMSIGEEKKFDVTSDNFYDLLVTLNNITSNKAKVTIKTIHEEFTPATTPAGQATTPGADGAAGEEGAGEEEAKKLPAWLFWTIIVVVAIIIIVLISVLLRKKR